MSQSELFEEIEPKVKPGAEIATFRVGAKLIHVPFSSWKDGRANFDLSAFGRGITRSRDPDKAEQSVVESLREYFKTQNVSRELEQAEILETVTEHFSRRKRSVRPRSVNKLATMATTPAQRDADKALEFIIPRYLPGGFARINFGLLCRKELSPAEKGLYGLLSSLGFRKEGAEIVVDGIVRHPKSTTKNLASGLGTSDRHVTSLLRSLRNRRLIHCEGRAGGRRIIRFLRHPWTDKSLELSSELFGEAAELSSSQARNSVPLTSEQSSSPSYKKKEPQRTLNEEGDFNVPCGSLSESSEVTYPDWTDQSAIHALTQQSLTPAAKDDTRPSRGEALTLAIGADNEHEFMRLLVQIMGPGNHPQYCRCGKGMCAYGGFWRKAWRANRRALREALGDMKLRTAPIADFGAALHECFERIKGERPTPRPRNPNISRVTDL